MTEDQAYEVMRPLAISFGFTEDSFEQWLHWVQELNDYAAAVKAAEMLCRDATERWVPGWRTFKDSYDRWVRRLDEERIEAQLALQSGEYSKMKIPTFEEGVEIAWKAYCSERDRLGLPKNREYFDSILNPMLRADRRATASATRQRR